MKKKAIVVCIFVAALMYSGCGSQSESSTKETTTSSTAEDAVKGETAATGAETTATEAPTVPATTEYVDAVTGYPGVYIANGMTTGVNLHAPAGMCLHNGAVYAERQSMMPEVIPTMADPFVIADEAGNNLHFYASAGLDPDAFAAQKQEDVEQEFLAGVEGIFDSCQITDYQTVTIDGYPGIRLTAESEMQGASFTQTMVMVNAVNPKNKEGYVYTFTYTDNTGDLAEAIETSISTIDFLDPYTLAQKYGTPEEYAAGETTSSPANTTAARQTVTTAKDVGEILEEAGVDSENLERIEEMLKEKQQDAENGVRGTLTKEEMIEKYWMN